jgi:hypothetical protein
MSVRFVGRGHPNIRATHAKTLELSPEPHITERATCVIAVDVRTADAQPWAGPLAITVRAGGHTHIVRARGNSSWSPGATAIVRRSPMQLPGSFAVDADAAAADLPRELVTALRSAQTVVEVDVTPAESGRPTLVLFAADASRPTDDRLRAELAAADRVLVEDPTARVLADFPPPGTGPRALVLATRELPGASVLAELADLGTDVETAGLPAQLAAAAASPSRAPLTIASGRPERALRWTPTGQRVLLRAEPGDLPALLELAGEVRPDSVVVLAQQFTAPVRVPSGAAATVPVQDAVYCCFAPAPAAAALDPAVQAAIRGLLADGVSTRTAARTLAQLTGLSRREAYVRVLAMSGRS